MILILIISCYITHSYYILIYYIITQWGRSPLDLAHKYEVVEILEREEKKLRK